MLACNTSDCYLCCLALICSAIAIQCKGHVAIFPILVCKRQARSKRYLHMKHILACVPMSMNTKRRSTGML